LVREYWKKKGAITHILDVGKSIKKFRRSRNNTKPLHTKEGNHAACRKKRHSAGTVQVDALSREVFSEKKGSDKKRHVLEKIESEVPRRTACLKGGVRRRGSRRQPSPNRKRGKGEKIKKQRGGQWSPEKKPSSHLKVNSLEGKRKMTIDARVWGREKDPM